MNEDRFSGDPSRLTQAGGKDPARIGANPAQSGWARIMLFSPMLSVHGLETAGLPIKAKAVLAYLATQLGRPVPREKLADLVWSRSGIEQARQSLRQTLVALRRVINPAGEAGQSDRLADCPPYSLLLTGLHVDSLDFEALAHSDSAEDWARAIALYQGALLAHFPPISEPFDDWLRLERTRLEDLASQTLHRLAAHDLANGRPQQAVEAAQRVLQLDPLREDSHRLLMRAYAEAGRRSDALRYYGEAAALLQAELGVKPDTATTLLAETIRQAVAESAGPPLLLPSLDLPSLDLPSLDLPGVEAQTVPAVAIPPPLARPARSWPRRRMLGAGLAALLAAIGLAFGWSQLREADAVRPVYRLVPFKTLANTEEARRFTAALTMRLTGGLGGIPFIKLITFQAGPASEDASYTINGVVDQGPATTHVEAWITDPKTGKVMANTHVDVPQGDLPAMQDAILGTVGDELSIAINQLYFPYPIDTSEKRHADSLVKQAHILIQDDTAENDERVLALLRQANALDPGNLDLAGRLATSLLGATASPEQREAYDRQARALLDLAGERGRWNRWISFANCRYWRVVGALDTAVNACNETRELLPWSPRVYKEDGYISQMRGELDDSLLAFATSDRLRRTGPARWTWFYAGGVSYLLLDRNQEAADWLRQSIALHDDDPAAHAMLAVAYQRLGDTARAAREADAFGASKGSLTVAALMEESFPEKIGYKADFAAKLKALRDDLDHVTKQ